MPSNRASGGHFFLGLAFGLGEVRAMIRRLCAGLRMNIRLTALSVSSPRDSGFSSAFACGSLSDIAALYHVAVGSVIIQLIGTNGSSYLLMARRDFTSSPAVISRRACPIAGEARCQIKLRKKRAWAKSSRAFWDFTENVSGIHLPIAWGFRICVRLFWDYLSPSLHQSGLPVGKP